MDGPRAVVRVRAGRRPGRVRLCQTPGVQPEQQVPWDFADEPAAAAPPGLLSTVPAAGGAGLWGWQWRVLFERRDLWVGLYWDRKPDGLHMYLCPLPTLAVHAHRKA